MSQDVIALMRIIVEGATSGTEEGVSAALALLADDMRFWQQGSGWITKADKARMWRGMIKPGAQGWATIHHLLADGDKVMLEMTIATPTGNMFVTMFGKFRDGQLVGGHEYFPSVDGAEMLG